MKYLNKISGWGRYSPQDVELLKPSSVSSLSIILKQEKTFKATYPNWEKLEALRKQYGAIGKFNSMKSKYFGLA